MHRLMWIRLWPACWNTWGVGRKRVVCPDRESPSIHHRDAMRLELFKREIRAWEWWLKGASFQMWLSISQMAFWPLSALREAVNGRSVTFPLKIIYGVAVWKTLTKHILWSLKYYSERQPHGSPNTDMKKSTSRHRNYKEEYNIWVKRYWIVANTI